MRFGWFWKFLEGFGILEAHSGSVLAVIVLGCRALLCGEA